MEKSGETKLNKEALNSPEQLYQSVKMTPLKGWLIWGGALLIILFALIWGIFGKVYITVQGKGIIIPEPCHIYEAVAQTEGLLLKFYVKPGDYVKKGTNLAEVQLDILMKKIQDTKNLLAKLQKQKEIIQKKIEFQKKELDAFNAKYLKSLGQQQKYTTSYYSFMQSFLKEMEQLRKQGAITKPALEDTRRDVFSANERLGTINTERARQSMMMARENFLWLQQMLELELRIFQYSLHLDRLTEQYRLGRYVVSPVNGQVNQIVASIGDYMQQGTPVITIVNAGETYNALSFFPPFEGKRINKSMLAFISPSTVKKDEYGTIKGKVVEVSEYPLNLSAMNAILKDRELGKLFSSEGPPVLCKLSMKKKNGTPSGFAWTSRDGPPYKVTAGTLCEALVVVDQKRPIELIVPFLKKYLLGE